MMTSAHPKLLRKVPDLELLQKVSHNIEIIMIMCAIIPKRLGMVARKVHIPLHTILQDQECMDILTHITAARVLLRVEHGECLRPGHTLLLRCTLRDLRIHLLTHMRTVTPCLPTILVTIYRNHMQVLAHHKTAMVTRQSQLRRNHPTLSDLWQAPQRRKSSLLQSGNGRPWQLAKHLAQIVVCH